MSEVTMKSTKQEIMDALKAAQAELARRSSIISDPALANRRTEEDACIAMAAKDVEANIFSAELNEKYSNLASAIALMEQRLTEQYEVDKTMLELVNLTNAAKQLRIQLEEDYAKRKKELEEELAKSKVDTNNAIAALAANYAEQKRQKDLERQRENEEYDYNRERERKADEDAYNDKMAEAKKNLEAVKAEAAAVAADTEAKKDEIEELRQQVADMPDKLQEQYDIGYAEGEKSAGKEYGYKKSMADKDHEYQVKDLNNQIARLNQALDEKSEKVNELEAKLDAAYGQIRELATKTVESNGSIKVIGGGADNSSKR